MSNESTEADDSQEALEDANCPKCDWPLPDCACSDPKEDTAWKVENNLSQCWINVLSGYKFARSHDHSSLQAICDAHNLALQSALGQQK